MIVKQKSLRVFHITIESKEEFVEYLKRNRVLLLEYFLLVDGNVDESIVRVLDDEGVCYKNISTCRVRFSGSKKQVEPKVVKEDEQLSSQEIVSKQTLRVYERPIRSGEEINEELPVTVFGRINSGAKLFCTQSVSIYGVIDGLVQCDGEYILLHGLSQRGNLIFNSEIVERELLLDDALQKITMKNGKLEIKKV